MKMFSWTSDLFKLKENRETNERQTVKERAELLRELKGAIQATVEFAALKSEENQQGIREGSANVTGCVELPPSGLICPLSNCELSETDHVVQDLLIWLERSFWHGLKSQVRHRTQDLITKRWHTTQDFDVSLWSVVQRFLLEENSKRTKLDRNNEKSRLAATVIDVRDLAHVRSIQGKGKAWLRTALNAKVLDSAVQILALDEQLLSLYYDDMALMRDEETRSLFMLLLAGLNGLEFRIHTDLEDFDGCNAPLRRPVSPVLNDFNSGTTAVEGVKPSFSVLMNPGTLKKDQPTRVLTNSESADGQEATEKQSWSQAMKSALDRATSAISSVSRSDGFTSSETDLFRFSGAARALHSRAIVKRQQREDTLNRMNQSATNFGVTLEEVALNPVTSALALMEPRIAVPDLLVRSIGILWQMYDASEIPKDDPSCIFSRPVVASADQFDQVILLKYCLTQIGRSGLTIFSRVGVDVDIGDAMTSIATTSKAGVSRAQQSLLNPKTVAGLVLTFLIQLPTPLVPQSCLSGLAMCCEIEEKEAQLRNVSLLMETFPQAHLASMDLLLMFLGHLTGGSTFSGKLQVAEAFGEAIFRPALSDPSKSETAQASINENYSSLLLLMIDNHERVMASVRQSLFELRSKLSEKVARIRAVSDGFSRMVMFAPTRPKGKEIESSSWVGGANSERNMTSLEILWDILGSNHELFDEDQATMDSSRLTVNTEKCSNEPFIMALHSDGWKSRGSISCDITKEFRGGGETALYDLTYFVSKHGKKSRMMLKANKFPFIQGACQVSRMTADILGITYREFLSSANIVGESRYSNPRQVVTSPNGLGRLLDDISAKPWWRMLDEVDATHRVFCMAFLLLDLNFTESNARISDFDRVLHESKRQMLDLLAMEPETVNKLWHSWIALRAERMMLMPRHQNNHTFLSSTERTTPVRFLSPPPPLTEASGYPTASVSTTDSHNGTQPRFESGSFPNTRSMADGAEISPLGLFDQLLPKLLERSEILTTEHIRRLETALPDAYHGYDWGLVFSTARDNCDLATLYNRCQDCGASIMVIRDEKGNCFGGFATEEWRVTSAYCGNGETFLFTLEPNFEQFLWSRKNNYFSLANEDSLAFGGGGEFGLFLDEDLQSGTSGPCSTFDSPCLTSKTDFSISVMEVWTFKTRRTLEL